LIFLSDGTLMGGELPKTFRVDATRLAPMVLRTMMTPSELFALPRESANRHELKRTKNAENLSISVNEGCHLDRPMDGLEVPGPPP
jgi:hypothetical protein